MGVVHNCESIGRSKVQGGETACPPYYLMDDMDLREGNKRRNKCYRNRHERGHPPISTVEGLAEATYSSKNWKLDGSTEGGSISDKCRISGGSGGFNFSVISRKYFVKGANTAKKMKGAIAGNSEIWRKKFTARKWAALIGFCGV